MRTNRTGARPLGLVPSIALAAALMLLLAIGRAAHAADDVKEPFFRFGGVTDNRAVVMDMPVETIDPFSGVLSLVHTDLVLPGRGGHDLRIVRAYNSKIWGRADFTSSNEGLVAEKELSPLGYGWSMHLGKLYNPKAVRDTSTCGGNNPVFEAPDGSRTVFYSRSDGKWVSKNFWELNPICSANSACITTDTGVKYEFSYSDTYWYGNNSIFEINRVLPVQKIIDLSGNVISAVYVAGAPGVMSSVTDSYGRQVTFAYNPTDSRYTSMTVNGSIYTFLYTAIDTNWAGIKKFLTEVRPPTGPSWKYAYVTTGTANENRNGLSQITFPNGGTITYTYAAVPFWTGYTSVNFNPVISRVTGGRGITSGTWSYGYSSLSTNTSGDTTTITRPDGKTDIYKFTGFAASGGYDNIWKIGLPISISRGSGAEVETFTWGRSAALTNVFDMLRAPPYGLCSGSMRDDAIYIPQLLSHAVQRDGATYTTSYANFDAYSQATSITESGQVTRTRTLTFMTSIPLHMLRGRPATEQVCVSASCVSNSWSYDANGRRITETLAGVTTGYQYDANGNVVRITDATGSFVSFSVFSNGVATSVSFNGQYTTPRGVNGNGWVTSVTNGRGHVTSYAYDAIGRITTRTPPAGAAITYTYAADGSFVKQTRGTYSVQTNLDGFGRPTGTSDTAGINTALTYNSTGLVTYRSYPYTTTNVGDTFAFDGLGRITQVTHPDTTFVQNTYTGTFTRVRNERGQNTDFYSQAFGHPDDRRLSKVVDAALQTTVYSYNTLGALTGIDAPGTVGDRSYSYNASGYLTSEVNPEIGTVSYGRNATGQMTSRTDARGVTSFGYDGLHRATSIDYPGTGADVTLVYDAEGNVTRVASINGGTQDFTYDQANRPTAQTFTIDGLAYTTSYVYNTTDCVTSMTYPTGTVLSFTCDVASRHNAITGYASAIGYHPSGQPSSMTFGNGLATTFGFDNRSRLTSITAAGIIGASYTYDGAGNVLTYNNSVTGSNKTLGYDVLDRLTSASGPWGTASYAYDALGNRVSKTEGALTTTFTYDGSGRLVSAAGAEPGTFGYDATGNLTSGDGFTFTWDDAGRVKTSSDDASYTYDGRGKRVKKVTATGTVIYHYDHKGNIIAESRGDGTRLRDYVYLGNKLIAMDGCDESGSCGVRRYFHADALGSVVAITDAASAVVCREDHRPFGDLHSTGSPCSERKYNGRILDEGTGLYYYGARYYNPTRGRFISADQIRGDSENPQSHNRYAYVMNNPYRYIDPTGLRAIFAGVQPVFTGLKGALFNENRAARDWYNDQFRKDTVVHAYFSSPTREGDEARVARFANYASGKSSWESLTDHDRAEVTSGIEAIKREKGDILAHSGGGAAAAAALIRMAETGGYDGTLRLDLREAVWSQEIQTRLQEKYGDRVTFTPNGTAGTGSDTFKYIQSKVKEGGGSPSKTESVKGATDHMDIATVPRKPKPDSGD